MKDCDKNEELSYLQSWNVIIHIEEPACKSLQ